VTIGRQKYRDIILSKHSPLHRQRCSRQERFIKEEENILFLKSTRGQFLKNKVVA
jgi:hypothetical protein